MRLTYIFPTNPYCCAGIFAAAWGRALGQKALHDPALHISPAVLQLGWARLERAQHDGAGAATRGAEQLALLPDRLPLLESMAECVSRGWMCLLVGPAGAGKTAAVRALAALAGRQLVELSLTSGTDTSDLLGGFEQVSAGAWVSSCTTCTCLMCMP